MNTFIEKEVLDQIGDDHQMTSAETPLRADAFIKSDAQKMESIARHFRLIMEDLGLDLTDDSLNGTPHRVAGLPQARGLCFLLLFRLIIHAIPLTSTPHSLFQRICDKT